jgi:hypothetical protein
MDVVQAVRDLWGSPTIDLLATKMNNRNALTVSWDGMNAYAFPPTPLIQAVLNKVMTDIVRLCLIALVGPAKHGSQLY